MAGIYIHIPYCRQACHYCDFHFSTSLKTKSNLVDALSVEIKLRKGEISEKIESIYFGGGTPSVLDRSEITGLLTTISHNYSLAEDVEITLEANPDDIADQTLKEWKEVGINRLSIGVQSFYEKDLKLMNRIHDADQAKESVTMARDHFANFSIDLIYGIPDSDLKKWEKNLEIALSLEIPHLSAYALTLEPKTALKYYVEQGLINMPDEQLVAQQFNYLVDIMEVEGYEHYEISNFGKPGLHSRNNTAYWQGKPYLGIGPSAHSFDGKRRSWNIANNSKYFKAIQEGNIPKTVEKLSDRDRYNEMVMTGLRTMWGVSLENIENELGSKYREYLIQRAGGFIKDGLLRVENEALHTTRKGKYLADGIASDLFMINLK